MAKTTARKPATAVMPESTNGSYFNAGDILDRTKELLSLESDTELAELLGRGRNVVSMWRKRKSVDLDLVLGVTVRQRPDANIGWVLTGQGSMILVTREGDTRDMGVDLSSPVIVEHIEDLVTLLKKSMRH